MKKLVLIPILFLSIVCIGQNTIIDLSTQNDTITISNYWNNAIIDLSKKYITGTPGIDSFALGLQLYYTYTYISNDSALFEPTNDTVMSFDKNMIVIDTSASSIIEIGMLVKFGNSEFTIIDTLGSRDSLMLSSNYYESIGDTMKIGVLPKLYDESENENNGTSSSGKMTRIIWGDSDTAHVRFDGVNDAVSFSNIDLGKQYTLVFWNIYADDVNRVFISDGGSSDWIQKRSDRYMFRVNSGGTTSAYSTVNKNQRYAVTFTRDEDTYKLYVNGSYVDDALLDNNDDWIINNLGGYAGQYFNGKMYEVRLYDRVLSENLIDSLYNITYDRLIRDTGFVAAYEVVDHAGACVGLDYDKRYDYILVGEYGGRDYSRIFIQTQYGITLDTVEFSNYVDLLQGISYDKDTIYYAWGTMPDSTNVPGHSVLVGVSSNGNKVFEQATPAYINIAQCGIQCEGDSAIWFKCQSTPPYIRKFNLAEWKQTDSILASYGEEGLWFDSDSTYWSGNINYAKQYRISDGSIRKRIPNPTVNWEGVTVDKRGWVRFNSDEYAHEGYGINGEWVFDPEFYDIEY